MRSQQPEKPSMPPLARAHEPEGDRRPAPRRHPTLDDAVYAILRDLAREPNSVLLRVPHATSRRAIWEAFCSQLGRSSAEQFLAEAEEQLHMVCRAELVRVLPRLAA